MDSIWACKKSSDEFQNTFTRYSIRPEQLIENATEKDFHARQVATLNSGGPQRYMLADEDAWNLFEKFLAGEEP